MASIMPIFPFEHTIDEGVDQLLERLRRNDSTLGSVILAGYGTDKHAVVETRTDHKTGLDEVKLTVRRDDKYIFSSVARCLELNTSVARLKFELRREPIDSNVILTSLEKNTGIKYLSIHATYSLSLPRHHSDRGGPTVYPFCVRALEAMGSRLTRLDLHGDMDRASFERFAKCLTSVTPGLKGLNLETWAAHKRWEPPGDLDFFYSTLKDHPGICALELPICDEQDARGVASVIRSNARIKNLRIHHKADHNASVMKELCHSLTSNHGITKLYVYPLNQYVDGYAGSDQILLPDLLDRCLCSAHRPPLKELSLAINAMRDEDDDSMIRFLEANPALETLKLVDLNNGPREPQRNVDLIRRGVGKCNSLRHFCFYAGMFQRSLDAISEILMRPQCVLEHVSLSNNSNSLYERYSFANMAQAMRQSVTLSTLKFCNFSVDDHNFNPIIDALMKGCPNLRYLKISCGNYAGTMSINGLAKALISNFGLRRLDLSYTLEDRPEHIQLPQDSAWPYVASRFNRLSYHKASVIVHVLLKRNQSCTKKQFEISAGFWSILRGRAHMSSLASGNCT